MGKRKSPQTLPAHALHHLKGFFPLGKASCISSILSSHPIKKSPENVFGKRGVIDFQKKNSEIIYYVLGNKLRK